MVTWEAQKKNALETAKREIPQIAIELNEWPQEITKDKSRRKPSLWSHEINDAPASVEEATAKYFRREGWIVTPSPSRLLGLFGIVEALASIDKGAEALFEKLLNNLLFYNDFCQILRNNKPSKPEKFEYWLQRVYDQKDDILALNYLDILGPILSAEHNKEVINHRNTDKEIEFIKKLYYLSPRQTWQTAYLIDRERFIKRMAGVPDLLIWNDDTYHMVEVKSPNDSLQITQAFFYRAVVKPLCINIFIARIIPLRGGSR